MSWYSNHDTAYLGRILFRLRTALLVVYAVQYPHEYWTTERLHKKLRSSSWEQGSGGLNWQANITCPLEVASSNPGEFYILAIFAICKWTTRHNCLRKRHKLPFSSPGCCFRFLKRSVCDGGGSLQKSKATTRGWEGKNPVTKDRSEYWGLKR